MADVKVLDYSSARPDAATIAAVGAVGVMRYLCPPTPDTHKKRLKRPELDALHAAGLRVGLVWQDGNGSDSWDGVEANRQADALGFPESAPIYYAEESSTPLGLLATRLDDLPGPRPKRLYDGAPRLQKMIDDGHVTGGWICASLFQSKLPGEHGNPTVNQAIARAPGAHLMQLTPVGKDLASTDTNLVLKPDWGGWHPDQPFEQEDDMTPEEHALLLDLHHALAELSRPTLGTVQTITRQIATLDARLAALEARLGAGP